MPQTLPQPQAEVAHTPSFESAPWVAQERVIEEPPRAPEPPLRLANEENVVDGLLDGESIVRVR